MSVDESILIAKAKAVSENGDWLDYLSHTELSSYFRITFRVSMPGTPDYCVAYDVDKVTRQCGSGKRVG